MKPTPKGSYLPLRLVILMIGAVLTGVIVGSPGFGTLVTALWLAGNLLWLNRRTAVMLGMRRGAGGWVSALRMLLLVGGLLLLLSSDVATALDVLIAVTWMYPGLALSFLVHS